MVFRWIVEDLHALNSSLWDQMILLNERMGDIGRVVLLLHCMYSYTTYTLPNRFSRGKILLFSDDQQKVVVFFQLLLIELP